MGVVLILGSGSKVYIPLIATGVFAALVITLPLIYEKLLTRSQRDGVAAALGACFGRALGRGGRGPVVIASAAEGVDAKRARDQQVLTGGYGRNWDAAVAQPAGNKDADRY